MPAANLFAVEPEIQARLETLSAQITGLTVGSALTLVGTARIHTLLPGIFFRPAPPEQVQQTGASVQERQIWEVICAVPLVPDKQGLSSTYAALGELAAAVIQVLHEYQGEVASLLYEGRDDPLEQPGHVELSLRFRAEVVLEAGEPANLGEFIRFFADWDLGPDPDGQLEAEDNVTLPTQEEI